MQKFGDTLSTPSKTYSFKHKDKCLLDHGYPMAFSPKSLYDHRTPSGVCQLADGPAPTLNLSDERGNPQELK